MKDKQLYDILLDKNFTGATLNNDGVLNFIEGYQVSVRDVATFKHMPVKIIVKCIQDLMKDLPAHRCVGLWLDNGTLYLDLSVNLLKKDHALMIAKLNHQKAIYNWATKECEAVE